jgi:hypothetical protein
VPPRWGSAAPRVCRCPPRPHRDLSPDPAAASPDVPAAREQKTPPNRRRGHRSRGRGFRGPSRQAFRGGQSASLAAFGRRRVRQRGLGLAGPAPGSPGPGTRCSPEAVRRSRCARPPGAWRSSLACRNRAFTSSVRHAPRCVAGAPTPLWRAAPAAVTLVVPHRSQVSGRGRPRILTSTARIGQPPPRRTARSSCQRTH